MENWEPLQQGCLQLVALLQGVTPELLQLLVWVQQQWLWQLQVWWRDQPKEQVQPQVATHQQVLG